MAEVIKRDSSRQAFSAQKVKDSIQAAAKEARLTEQRIRQVVEDASKAPLGLANGVKSVETRMIRGIILTRLDVIEPSVTEAWRSFDSERK
jgi:transcriptional regulator NrdR family protein